MALDVNGSHELTMRQKLLVCSRVTINVKRPFHLSSLSATTVQERDVGATVIIMRMPRAEKD